MATLLKSEGLPQALTVLSADVSYHDNLVAEWGAAPGSACSECWCQLPWQPCCRVRGCPRLCNLCLFSVLMSVTMATLLQSEGLPQALPVLSVDVSYHDNLVAEWGAAPGSVIFACFLCWCQLPWQPCCRARGCPRHCNPCLFWVLVSVTMTTLLQSEGLPQAQKLILQLQELVPLTRSSLHLGIQPPSREASKNGDVRLPLC